MPAPKTQVLTMVWSDESGKVLDSYIMTCYPIAKGQWPCGFCGATLAGAGNLRSHLLKCMIDEGENPFE